MRVLLRLRLDRWQCGLPKRFKAGIIYWTEPLQCIKSDGGRQKGEARIMDRCDSLRGGFWGQREEGKRVFFFFFFERIILVILETYFSIFRVCENPLFPTPNSLHRDQACQSVSVIFILANPAKRLASFGLFSLSYTGRSTGWRHSMAQTSPRWNSHRAWPRPLGAGAQRARTRLNHLASQSHQRLRAFAFPSSLFFISRHWRFMRK